MTSGPPPQTQTDWVIAKLQDIGNTLDSVWRSIATIMATEQSFADRLTSIQATLTGEEGVIQTLTTGIAGLRQQIADLQAQVAAGADVTRAQLTALDAQAADIQSTTASQLGELQNLATPPTP